MGVPGSPSILIEFLEYSIPYKKVEIQKENTSY